MEIFDCTLSWTGAAFENDWSLLSSESMRRRDHLDDASGSIDEVWMAS